MRTRSHWRHRRLRSEPTNCIGENQNHKTTQLKLLMVETSCSKSPLWQFGDNKYCDKSDLVLLICYVTSHNPLFK